MIGNGHEDSGIFKKAVEKMANLIYNKHIKQ
jgi:hypothetical protein